MSLVETGGNSMDDNSKNASATAIANSADVVTLPALSNICISSAGNWGCYQAGVMRYCVEHFDVLQNVAGNNVLFTGASSGSLVSFLILGGWDPVRILTLFSQYYLTHHVLLAGDAASLATQYLKDLIQRELSAEKQQALLQKCNERLFIQISERMHNATNWMNMFKQPSAPFKGVLKHGWVTLNEVLLDIECSCAIPFFTTPGRALMRDEPTYLDGAFTDLFSTSFI